MFPNRAPRPFAPHFKDRDMLRSVSTQDLAEHVDVAFAEFMTAICHCIAGVSLPREAAIAWVLANMATGGGYGWTQNLADEWNVRITADGKSFSALVTDHVAGRAAVIKDSK
jgi:hypothetical protein